MVRAGVLLLLALAPFARAYPVERPVSDPRVGIAAESSPYGIVGAAGDDRFLVTWHSIDRGGQAALFDAAGNRIGDTSFGLPMSEPRFVFWHDGAWTVIGSVGISFRAVRVSRDGVLDPAVRELPPPFWFGNGVWTGSSFVLVSETFPGGVSTLHVLVYDADLNLLAREDIVTGYVVGTHVVSDGETALLAYHQDLSLKTVLVAADGSFVKKKEFEGTPWVTAAGSEGGGSGYLFLTLAGTQGDAQFGSFRLDHDLVKRSILGTFGHPKRLYATSGTLLWDGSAFVFFYHCGGDETTEVRMMRLSAAGTVLDDGVATTGDRTIWTDRPITSVAGMGTSLLLFTRSETFLTSEQFLRARAGHDAAGMLAAEEVELERGALQQLSPAAASNAAQSLVVWRERFSVRERLAVYATRVDASGAVVDPHSLLLGTSSCARGTPGIATNGDSFLVVWYDDAGVAAARVGADGSVANRRIQHFREEPCEQLATTVVSNGTDYLVVWTRSDHPRDEVYAVRIAADGSPLDTVPIDLGTAATPISAASDGNDYLLAWDGRMLRVAANGTRLDRRIEQGAGTRVHGTATTAAWWNGTAYSLVQSEPAGFGYRYQFARVAPNGTVTKIGEPVSWPAYDPAQTWGSGPFVCEGARCTAMIGTVAGGESFLQPIEIVDDGTQPVLRLGKASPVAPVVRRPLDEPMAIVPFGIPGGRRYVALTRFVLEAPYAGISRVFLRPAEVVRGRAVRH